MTEEIKGKKKVEDMPEPEGVAIIRKGLNNVQEKKEEGKKKIK